MYPSREQISHPKRVTEESLRKDCWQSLGRVQGTNKDSPWDQQEWEAIATTGLEKAQDRNKDQEADSREERTMQKSTDVL